MESSMINVTPLEDGELSDSQRSSNLVHYNEIFEMLYYRYGFVAGESRSIEGDDANTSDEMTSLDSEIQKQWRLVTKIMASNAAIMPDATEPVSLAFKFITAFADKGYVPNPATHTTWDLNVENPCHLRDIMDKSLLRITRESDESGVIFYTIGAKDVVTTRCREKWTLVIQYPITVLEILRRSLGPNMESVVNFLVHSGIPFNTVIASNTYPPPPRLRLSPPVGLGMRLRNFSPDPEEYRFYEKARDDFLSGSFGRAALLKGGIIWRLAKEVVPISEVFNGPTQLASDFGQLVLTTGGDDMIDDDFSDEQLDLILGLYHISHHGRTVKQVSWWPKHETWKECGLDVGYWSSSCERWFQNRLRAIRNSAAFPRTTAEWQNALSYQETSTVVDNVGKAADIFLQDTLITPAIG